MYRSSGEPHVDRVSASSGELVGFCAYGEASGLVPAADIRSRRHHERPCTELLLGPIAAIAASLCIRPIERVQYVFPNPLEIPMGPLDPVTDIGAECIHQPQIGRAHV